MSFGIFNLAILLVIVGQVSAATEEATADDVDRCYNRLAQKIRSMNGDFMTQEQSVQLLTKAMDMYLVDHKTLQEISDYFKDNIKSVGLSPDQSQTLTDVYGAITDMFKGSGVDPQKTYKQAMNITFGIIAADQSEVDEKIAQMHSEGASMDTIRLVVCQMGYKKTTPQRKQEMIQAIAELIPAEKRQALKVQLQKIIKL